jgi:coenzyme F420-reducing hydrogenase delta subunit
MNNQEMTQPLNILLFLCNWGPHSAFLTLQDQLRPIPNEIRMVRTPCTGRIDRAMMLKAFAKGADGVALVGCQPGTCRYGSGTATSQRNTHDVQRVLDIMGLGGERLRFATFLPEQSEELLSFLQEFSADIRRLGPAGVKEAPVELVTDVAARKRELQQLVETYDIHACQDCGKCTSACPLVILGWPLERRFARVDTGRVASAGRPLTGTGIFSRAPWGP